jgi:hypothetical protein
MEFLPKAFEALESVSQFIVYRLTDSKSRTGKKDKLPIDARTGHTANAHDPAIWTNAQQAIHSARTLGAEYGVGFVFTENDPFFFIDLDNCLEPCGTKWSPLALSICNAFPGAAVEISSSGRGLHIIGSGRAPVHTCRNDALKLEFYTSGRFVALTGTSAQGSVGTEHAQALEWLVSNYFAPVVSTLSTPHEWTDTPCEGWNGNTDDAQLFDRMIRSQSARSAFGDGVSFRDLWEADETALAKAYPPNDSDTFDRSRADAALAQRLAFWTGNDCERIRRFMMFSKLVREKWDRDDYLPRTIQGVCGRQKEWLNDKPPQSIIIPGNTQPASDGMERPRAVLVTGATYLTVEQQIDVFEGCVYVADEHKVLIPGGYLFTPDRFRTMYGGYSMPMDMGNERVTRNAWEAFTESQAYRSPRADTSCFRPDLPAGSIIQRDGQRLANIYWPVHTPRAEGDVSRFLRHIEKLFPDPRDQAIILAYLAALIQHKGIKFQWAPLIQGVEGNGKTYFTRVIAFAIGNRYSHFPKAAEIASKFNDWLYGKIFIGVEDIYLFDSKNEVMETLKPMLTSERQEIEPKGGAKITRDICANFLINTNHKDGLRKTTTDRRFAPFYTAQQTVSDLKRDGMLGDYFPDLYAWSERGQGYASIAHYLERYIIPDEFNPATYCKRAPQTSSTEAAIEHGRGGIEQEILEAIEQSLAGFKGGWVSSIMLDRLLVRLQAARRMPPNRRREMMETLGYIWHPGLKEGRVNNDLAPDNGKPRLYIRIGHKDSGLTSAGEIARAYTLAQNS